VADQQVERPSRPTRTVLQEHTRIRCEVEGHTTLPGQSAGLDRRRGALPQRPDSRGAESVRLLVRDSKAGKTTGCHLTKVAKLYIEHT
jgi:hypothetical protein